MNLKEKAKLIIYRFRERGLEIFLVPEEDQWQFPQGPDADEKAQVLMQEDRLIALDPVHKADGETEQAYAVEGDWHDIPSLKGMLYEDAVAIKEKIEELEQGSFVAIKEAIKRALPHQYQLLKELKEVLVDRNLTRNI
ncbi:MAG: hypothetical protein KF852_02335 [Saprospiraceae bacterium]|nr:hypothetical protein [Saprospiraceae bacterium]